MARSGAFAGAGGTSFIATGLMRPQAVASFNRTGDGAFSTRRTVHRIGPVDPAGRLVKAGLAKPAGAKAIGRPENIKC